MKQKITQFLCISLMAAVFSEAFPQTKCIWFDKSENGTTTQKIGVSVQLVKLLARPGADFSMGGVKLTYDSLLTVYKNGAEIWINDSTGGRTKIYGGKFSEKMNERTERHNHLIIESTDSGQAMKSTKIRVESVEAVGVLLAMIGSKNFEEDTDRIEAMLERGGILYIHDFKKNSRLWLYVN
ncbi:MAG: hypothetical protein KGJ59_01065 [Bacteroidota bacterium]|nr:hypothetical protein [Bacteroidota bacterium]